VAAGAHALSATDAPAHISNNFRGGIVAGNVIDESSLDVLFRSARSHNAWLERAVGDDELRGIYELMKWGPTSANCFPIRIAFVRSPRLKQRLAATADERNAAKIMTAPVTAVLGYDTSFYDWLPRLFPHAPQMRDYFASNPQLAMTTALRNGSLQGAYFMIAARSVGLDCGPMSGFDNAAVDRLFFADGKVRSNFICGLGYGDHAGVWPRLPRPAFEEICAVC
jgi:3-hydroxypropanoate dehydrogenase